MLRRIHALLLVLTLGASACSGGSDTSQASEGSTTSVGTDLVVVTSEDGSVTVEAGAGAPDITIDRLDVSELGLPDDFESFGAYELGPSGFDGGATVTVATGVIWGADQLQVPIGLLGDGEGAWEVVETATVSEVDGEITVAFDVPHFSVLVVAGSPWGLEIDPWFVEAAVGERWDAYWDLVDPKLERIAHTRPFRTYAFPDDTGIPVVGTVRALLAEADVRATPRSGGAVSFDPFEEPRTGTYDDHLAAGFDLRDSTENQYVEVFYGTDVFTCLAPGEGVYGFQVEVWVDRPDLLFAQRYGNRLEIINPSDGVVLRYAIAAPARCVERGGTIRSRIIQHYLEFDQMQTQQVLDATMHDDDPAIGPIFSIDGVAAGLRLPRVDIVAFGGFQFDERQQIGVDLRYNFSVFGCADTQVSDLLPGIEVLTVCGDDPADVETGGMVLVVAEHADALPRAGSEEHYTYAVVFDSDGDPANDWQYQDPFDWDFFQGADRWYQLDWDPAEQSWSLAASDGLDPFGPSAARAVLAGNTILWLIPASEIGGGDPTFRVTAFAHDGTYAAEASGGDVSGADPTLPLTPLIDLAG